MYVYVNTYVRLYIDNKMISRVYHQHDNDDFCYKPKMNVEYKENKVNLREIKIIYCSW